MNIKHYDIPHNGKAWFGYERYGYPLSIKVGLRRESKQAHDMELYSERECEVDCFISVLMNVKEINLLDLGSGWGEWSMALDGVIKNRILTHLKGYSTLAVECDSNHYKWLDYNFQKYVIQGNAILGAIGDKHAFTRINTGMISNRYCGSSLSFGGYFSGSKTIALMLGAYHYITRQTQKVTMYKIDELVERFHNFVIMDIQGGEILAYKGARQSIDYGMIDYWMIGTHGLNVHDRLVDLMQKDYDVIVDAKPNKITQINSDYKVICQKGQDGILLCKRKNI